MDQFFKPRRRKIGVVTLLIALVFAGGWVRSLTLMDTITLPICGGGSGLLISEKGCFICTWSMSPKDEVAGRETIPVSGIQFVHLGTPEMWNDKLPLDPEQERLVADAVPAADEVQIERRIIPYWLTNTFQGGASQKRR